MDEADRDCVASTRSNPAGHRAWYPRQWDGLRSAPVAGEIIKADCSERHAGTGLAQIREAIGSSGGQADAEGAVGMGVAGRAIAPGRS